MAEEHFRGPVNITKTIVSILLLIFSLILIFGLIFTEQTSLSEDSHPAWAFLLFVGAISWLTMIEGGQGALVGLAPVNGELFKESHPLSYLCTSLVHKGDNLDRYLMGRQLMVVLVVFSVNISGAPIKGAELWGFPDWLTDLFLVSGLAMILVTCMVGQLNSQVNGSLCMLDYINNYFAVITVWVAMAIEFSGLLHASYVFQILVAKIAGQEITSQEPEKSIFQKLFFWFRCLASLAILGFAFAVTLDALFNDKTTIWTFFPPGAAVVVFFFLLCVVGMLEGMQIAFFYAAKLTNAERERSFFGKRTCQILYSNKSRNLAGFMIGRQLMVVSCMFFVARITSVEIEEGESNIFDVSDSAQKFFDTGLLGALIVTIVGSIAWQLVASAFPMFILGNPVTYVLLRCCLFLEWTGICNGAWALASAHKYVAKFRRDEVYIGTAEERAARQMKDEEDKLHFGAGHIIKPPQFEVHTLNNFTKEEVDSMIRDMVNYQRELDSRINDLEEYKINKGWVSRDHGDLEAAKSPSKKKKKKQRRESSGDGEESEAASVNDYELVEE